ncbi:hypothetical protein [Stieleria varia]|uniref:Uncharacterized protein n=1 Tax=Stieleria varia TaxID=2528005 RepID=A0A5C6AZY4_9BACT|nr:hypothetical protein [Stieleria varia]TWU05077.1 hypothetical protein Pla52n_31230 [Stieleria varia]
MLKRIRSIIRACLILGAFILMPRAMPALLMAQDTSPASSRSVKSWIADSQMSSSQEENLELVLQAPSPFAWDHQTTILDIHRDLSTVVQAVIDQRSFDEIGVDCNRATRPELASSMLAKRTRETRVITSNSDPFGSPVVDDEPAGNESAGNESASDTPWWKSIPVKPRASSDVTSNSISLLSHLDSFLAPVDATITIRSGQITITTIESAEMNGYLRVYDVTSLVEKLNAATKTPVLTLDGFVPNDSNGWQLTESLQQMVESDCWVNMGGASDCRMHCLGTRRYLVVRTRLITHCQVQAYLDSLAR